MIRNVTAMMLLLASASASAAICTWTGNGSDDKWSNADNWDTCQGLRTTPINTDKLVFPDGAARKTNTNDIANLQPSALEFGGLNYDISGNAITLTPGPYSGIIVNTPVGGFADLGPRFRPNVTLGGGQTFSCSAGKFLYLDGTLNLNSHPLAIDGACNTALRGVISGSGELKKFGTGSLYLQLGPYTYTGPTTVYAGTLYAGTDSALGATGSGNPTTVNSGAMLSLYLGAALNETVHLNGGTLENFLGDNTLAGPLVVDVASTVDVAADTTLRLSGTVDGEPLTKIGGGTLVLTGTGSTALFVEGGTAEVDGTMASATITDGGTLAGKGVLLQPVFLQTAGTLAPGTAARAGVLTSTYLQWYAEAKMRMRLGSDCDRVALTQNLVKIGSSGTYEFQFRDGATPPKAGVEYTLIDYAAESGFDAGSFAYSYQGTGAGSSLTGYFQVSQYKVTFTATAVVSDLVFRDGVEP